MIATLVSLPLTPSWRTEQLVLVRATDGLRLCREGSHALLSAREAGMWVDRLGNRDMDDVRAFFASARPARLLWAPLKDQVLLGYLREAVRRGDWVVLRPGSNAEVTKGTSTAEQRRIVRAIENRLRGRINHMGRQYKLVADADLHKLPGRDDFEVVRHDDATRVLAALSSQPSLGNDLAESFAKARELLAHDWRPPLMPDGLVLLHKVVQQAASKQLDEPAMSPSQLQKLRDPTEVEFEEFEEPEDLDMLVEQDDDPDLETEVALDDGGDEDEPPAEEEAGETAEPGPESESADGEDSSQV